MSNPTVRQSVNAPNIKLLLKDNHVHKKCYRCQQLGSFICEHSTKYRDELKTTKDETGKFYQAPKPNMSERSATFKKSKSQMKSSIDDTTTSVTSVGSV